MGLSIGIVITIANKRKKNNLKTFVILGDGECNEGSVWEAAMSAPKFELDFLKELPTTWDETRYIDGYPGKFSVLARRNGDTWYVAGINAESKAKKLQLDLSFLAGKKVALINDDKKAQTFNETLNIPKNGKLSITVQPGGGFVIVNKQNR